MTLNDFILFDPSKDYPAFLGVVTVGVGLILNASMGGELGHTIIHYAVIIGGIVAGLWLGFMLFFA